MPTTIEILLNPKNVENIGGHDGFGGSDVICTKLEFINIFRHVGA